MTKLAHLTAAAMIVLALAGCSAAQAPVKADRVAAPSAAPTVTAEPITVAPSAPAAKSSDDSEKTFLTESRIRLKGIDSVTDAQLVTAAHYACDQLAAGTARTAIAPIMGSSPDEPVPGWNNTVIVTWASFTYCTQYKVD